MMSRRTFHLLCLGMLALYGLLFLCRAAYDLITFEEADIVSNYSIYYSGEKEDMVRNYASSRMDTLGKGAAEAAPSALEQKYERIATLVSKTVDYDGDLDRFSNILEEHEAVVQMEDSRGLAGSRRVDMVIGVRPGSFDSMQAALSGLGRVISSSSSKTDKTAEYRRMLAQKETLERRLENYYELRERSASVSELLELEDKIIDLEGEIQEQLVDLGEYSDENALCTINFTLYEGEAAGVPRKLWNALKWSTLIYGAFLAILTVTAAVAYLLVAIWAGLRRALTEKPEDRKQDPVPPYPTNYPAPPPPPAGSGK